MFKKALLFGSMLIGASSALENCQSDISVAILPRSGVASWTEDLLTKTILDIDIDLNTCNLVDLQLALNIPLGCVVSSTWNLNLNGLLATVTSWSNKPGLILGCPFLGKPTVSLTVSLAQCSSACGTMAPATKAPTTKAPTTKAPTTKAPTTKAPTTKAPTTKAPTTKAPTTKAPTTQAPTTQAPTTQAPTTQAPKKINEVATFDDITALPGLGLAVPVPYKDVYFSGFDVLQTVNTKLTPGIYPESGNQYAINEIHTTLLQGQASMTSNYAGSNVKSFDLNSLYFGCALITGNGATSTPQQCNLFISGYKKGSNTPIILEATFTPPSILASAQLQLVTLPNTFSNLVDVQFTYVFPNGLTVLDGLLGLAIDTVKYSVTLN